MIHLNLIYSIHFNIWFIINNGIQIWYKWWDDSQVTLSCLWQAERWLSSHMNACQPTKKSRIEILTMEENVYSVCSLFVFTTSVVEKLVRLGIKSYKTGNRLVWELFFCTTTNGPKIFILGHFFICQNLTLLRTHHKQDSQAHKPNVWTCSSSHTDARRIRGDLIETFKILKGYERSDKDYFFEIAYNRDKLQGHEFKLYKMGVKINVMKEMLTRGW